MEAKQDTCYLCLGESSLEDAFIDPHPCNCKGSIRLHKSCFEELFKTSKSCGICKTRYKDRFTGIRQSHVYYSYGPILEASYVEGVLEGPYKLFDYGKLVEEGTYVAAMKEGICKKYRCDGSLEEEITYRANKKHGPQIKHHPSGNQVQEIFWNEDVRDGPTRKYVYGTEWHLQEEFLYDKNKLTVVRQFYQNGQMKSEKHYTEDHLHGPYIIYSEHGTIKEEGYFENDSLNGTYKLYAADGSLSEEREYVNGILHGSYKIYHHGKLKTEYNYMRGIRLASYIIFDELGKMKRKNR
jgi:antitoxin component YwqK of YwqJK toxin-antitoxin module